MRLSHRDTEPLPSLTGWPWRSLSFAEPVLPQSYSVPAPAPVTMTETKQPTPLLCSGREGGLYRKHLPTDNMYPQRRGIPENPLHVDVISQFTLLERSLCLSRPAGFREVFIVHSKSNVTQVRKHLLYMIVNPVTWKGLWGHTRGNIAQQMTMEMAQNQTKCRTILSYGFKPQKRKKTCQEARW